MRKLKMLFSLLPLMALSSCASMPESLVASPDVDLQSVQVVGLGFKNQTFLLSFAVANPNDFSLPIREVAYAIRLDGQRFASGATASEFTVPANGRADFAISVELDLLRSSPEVLSLVRGGNRRDFNYELEGQFALDIPLAPAVAYRESGSVRLGGGF